MADKREVPKQVLMLVPCDLHLEAVVSVLEGTRVSDWVIVPAGQARRSGILQYVPRRRERTCDVVLGMADAPTIVETLNQVIQAVSGRQLCANCLAYTWKATQIVLADVALDPVCLMVVNCDQTLSAMHEGVTHYFCSPECRDRFISDPDAFARPAPAASGAPAD